MRPPPDRLFAEIAVAVGLTIVAFLSGIMFAETQYEDRRWNAYAASKEAAPTRGFTPTDWRIIYDPQGGKDKTGSFLRCEDVDKVPIGSYRRIEEWRE